MKPFAGQRGSVVRIVLLSLTLAAALGSAACKSEKSEEAAPDGSGEALGTGAPGEHPHGKRELPPAAFDACQGKNAGDACTVQFGTRTVEAQCSAAPDGRLACHPQGKHKKPEGD